MHSRPLPSSLGNTSAKQGVFNTVTYYLVTTLRALRFQLLPQLTQWKRTKEVKKTARFGDRGAVILYSLQHLLPLAACLTLVILNFETKFLGLAKASLLTTLQFAAKLLEILIQHSIATLVLSFVRDQVLGPDPFPFGGLLAPYRTTDVSYLWSLEMWGCFSSRSIHGWRKLLIWICIPATVVLATLVGPAAAVLMIPRPINIQHWRELLFLNQSELVYPPKIDFVDGLLATEDQFNQSIYQIASGLDSAGSYALAFRSDSAIVPVTDRAGTRSLLWSYQANELGEDGSSRSEIVSTIPTRLSLSALSDRSSSLVLGTTLQPYVRNSCWSSSKTTVVQSADTEYVDFGPGKSHLKGTVSYQMLIPGSDNQTNDELIEILRVDGSPHSDAIYLGGWLQPTHTASNHSMLAIYARTNVPYSSWTVWACTIDAYWTEVSTNYSSTLMSASIVNEHPNIVVPRLSTEGLIRPSVAWVARVFHLSSEQMPDSVRAFIHQGIPFALALSDIPSISQREWLVGRVEPTLSNETGMTDQQLTILGEYIKNNKLLSKYDWMYILSNNTNWTDPASLGRIDIRGYLTGYGYDTSSVAVRLSLAVLLTYICGTTGYLIHSFITGNVASSWDTVSELVTLALNSARVPELENTSVGIDTLETFRQPVNIRVNGQRSAELVFRGKDAGKAGLTGFSDVEPNEKY